MRIVAGKGRNKSARRSPMVTAQAHAPYCSSHVTDPSIVKILMSASPQIANESSTMPAKAMKIRSSLIRVKLKVKMEGIKMSQIVFYICIYE